jgi:uncharacterized protein (DUF58 family)
VSVLHALAPPEVKASAKRYGRFGESVGRRFVLLILAGLAWTLPALWVPTYRWAMIAWDGLLLVAYALDRMALPAPEKIEVARCWKTAQSLGVPGEVALTVSNHARNPLQISWTDHLPEELVQELPKSDVAVRCGAEKTTRYVVTPRERGDCEAGLVYLKYRSIFGLAERWAVADLRQKLRVYPNFEQAKEQSLYLARSRRIELQMRMMRLRGQGSEFESLRDYRENDEPRAICWTATARRGKVVTRNYQVERSQAVWAVIDCGRLMNARTEGHSKLDRAVDAALCLAQLAMYSGDRFGLLTYGREVTQRVKPGRGAAHLRQILESLAVVRGEWPEADHLRAASSLLSMQSQRAMVFWITDLAETAMTPEVVESAGQLVSRHVLAFIAVAQPELKRTAAEVPETAEQMYEGAAALELVNRRELLLARLRARGAMTIESMPGDLSTNVLNEYLRIKERNIT